MIKHEIYWKFSVELLFKYSVTEKSNFEKLVLKDYKKKVP